MSYADMIPGQSGFLKSANIHVPTGCVGIVGEGERVQNIDAFFAVPFRDFFLQSEIVHVARKVLVTAGASVIGKHIASAFIGSGADMYACDLNE